MKILDTGISNVRNVAHYSFGAGSLDSLPKYLQSKRKNSTDSVIFFVDEYFSLSDEFIKRLPIGEQDHLIFVSTKDEPTTQGINTIYRILGRQGNSYVAVVGIGGGITLDTAKAISNLLSNGGMAEDYQGWDLLSKPGVYKIAVPTISGTGAEATRTCVMTNKKTGAKLGMNSDFTVFDQILFDPDLTSTVPRNQYFYTGMDAYIHCKEALSGSYRNSIGDALSSQSLQLCRKVFLGNDMMSDENRANLMVASYLGGCAIATSYVGIVHPFSAGLSVVLGLHHGEANCIALNALDEYYGAAHVEFLEMANKQSISIPTGICSGLSESQYDQLYKSTIVHEKPLTNALGDNYELVLTKEKVCEIFSKM